MNIEGWKFKKEVSVVDIITIVMAASSLMYVAATFDKRLTVVENVTSAQYISQTLTDRRQDEDSLRYQARIDVGLSSLNAKLDRLLERR